MQRRGATRVGVRRVPGRVSRGILAAAILIGVGLPGLYYAYGLHALRDLASLYAHELAHQVAAVLREAPQPGAAPAPEIRSVLHEFLALPHQNVTSVQLLDGAGRPISVRASVAPVHRVWPSLPSLIGTAPIMVQRQPVGKVEVRASQKNLLREACAFFVVCALASISIVILMPQPLKKRSRGRTRVAFPRSSGVPPSDGQPTDPRVPFPLQGVADPRGRPPESLSCFSRDREVLPSISPKSALTA